MLKNKDRIILGTADFGGRISLGDSQKILDIFLEKSKSIQTSTNYPMQNDIPFGETIVFLKNYLEKNNIVSNLTINIGSLSNNYSNINDITPTFFYANFLMFKEMFPKQNLTLAIHWDDQNESRIELLDLFNEIQHEVKIGLSGIRFPYNYSSNKIEYECQVNSYIDKKNNYMFSTELKKHLKISSVIGYQLLGGKKIETDRMNQIFDLYGEKETDINDLLLIILKENLLKYDQVIIGPKNTSQTLSWLKTMELIHEN